MILKVRITLFIVAVILQILDTHHEAHAVSDKSFKDIDISNLPLSRIARQVQAYDGRNKELIEPMSNHSVILSQEVNLSYNGDVHILLENLAQQYHFNLVPLGSKPDDLIVVSVKTSHQMLSDVIDEINVQTFPTMSIFAIDDTTLQIQYD